jgi:hypothetical protein
MLHPTIFFPLFTAKSRPKSFDEQGPFRKFYYPIVIGSGAHRGILEKRMFFGIVFFMLIPLEESIRIQLKSTWRICGVRWGQYPSTREKKAKTTGILIVPET